MLHYLFIHNLIHDLEAFDGLLLCDADISLLQGHRAETAEQTNVVMNKQNNNGKCPLISKHVLPPKCSPVVKVEESLGRVYTQAGGHVFVVGQCGAEAQQTHILLGQLHVADGSGHQRLQYGSTVIVKQVDFILGNTVTLS